MLSDPQIERYSRQIILPQVGGRGQVALLSATLDIRGSNQIASTAALYLAAAGVGFLRVSAPTAAVIEAVNPDCHIIPEGAGAAAGDAVRPAAVLCAGAGADLCGRLNAACVRQHVPLIIGDIVAVSEVATAAGALPAHGADAVDVRGAKAVNVRGWMSVCAGGDPLMPCYSCLSPRLEAIRCDAASAAPLGTVTAGFIGALMATEAMKIVLGLRPASGGCLVTFDALAGEIHEAPVAKDPQCAVCGGLA